MALYLITNFEEHIKNKIHNTQHIKSNCFSLRSKQYKIPDKTMINLCKVFIIPNFDYGDVALITAEIKYIYKWEQIQFK